jgi:hypothetical protein
VSEGVALTPQLGLIKEQPDTASITINALNNFFIFNISYLVSYNKDSILLFRKIVNKKSPII